MPSVKEETLCDSTDVKFKNKQNSTSVLEVRKRRAHERMPRG